MKSLYFDLVGGISGDMAVAALLDLGVDFNFLKRELAKLKIKGFFLKKAYAQRGHVKAVKFDCCVNIEKNRSFQQIVGLIENSKLRRPVKDNFKKIYCLLRDAEIEVHGHKHKDIHFYQLGEIDSIIDIAAVCVCLDKLEINRFYFGPIPVGKKISPAAFKLFAHKEIYFTDQMFENVTPTGMAILAALGRQVDSAYKDIFKVGRCGYGAGSVDATGNCNVLRIAELENKELEYDELYVIETNIDDMNPEFFDHVFDRLFEAGALDVSVSSLYMKKTRPGFLLTVLLKPEKLDIISRFILTETSSLGVRYYPVRRLKLPRQERFVVYKGSKVGFKSVWAPGGGMRMAPEYDDCKAIAEKTKIPIAKIYDEVKQRAQALMTA